MEKINCTTCRYKANLKEKPCSDCFFNWDVRFPKWSPKPKTKPQNSRERRKAMQEREMKIYKAKYF